MGARERVAGTTGILLKLLLRSVKDKLGERKQGQLLLPWINIGVNEQAHRRRGCNSREMEIVSSQQKGQGLVPVDSSKKYLGRKPTPVSSFLDFDS